MRILIALLAALPVAAQPKGGLAYIGTWPSTIHVIDENQQKVVGKIDLKTGSPRSIHLFPDKKRMLALTMKDSGVEIVDLATRQVTSSFLLNDNSRRVRVNGLAIDPGGKLVYASSYAVVKKIDRFEVEKPKWLVIDLDQQKIVKSFDMPEDVGGRFGSLIVSPDGKFLYQFRDSVYVYSTEDFKQVEKIELTQSTFADIERAFVGFGDDPHQEPGVLIGIFNSSDPIVHRNIFGIARFDLAKRTFDFTPVGPASPTRGLHLTPDRKLGYTVSSNGFGANARYEFWVFDIATRKLMKKQEFEGRTRFMFEISSSGKKLYVYGAGFEVEVFDAQTMKLDKVIDVAADMTTSMLVVPAQ